MQVEKEEEQKKPQNQNEDSEKQEDIQNKSKKLNKYDLVKVMVTNEETKEEYQLSRFIIARTLSASNVVKKINLFQVNIHGATKIAKAVKIRLVDQDMKKITQKELNSILFEEMIKQDFGHKVETYKRIQKFFEQRQPLMILLAGTHLTLKTTISGLVGDRLNIGNIISSDLLGLLVNEYKGLNLPTQSKSYLSLQNYLELFQQSAKNIWKAATQDIAKVFADGKPLIFEGRLDYQYYIDSPYLPCPERFKAYKSFVEGKLDISQISDNDELFSTFNFPVKNRNFNKIANLDWMKENALKSEITMVEKLEKSIAKISYKNSVMLPIILIIKKSDHLYLVKEDVLNECVYKWDTVDQEKAEKSAVDLMEKYQKIQDWIVENCPGIIVPLRLEDNDLNYDLIHHAFVRELVSYVPEKISE